MPSEVELERMIVRLLGDQSGHKNMWKQAEDTARQGSDSIQKSANQASSISSQLRGIGLAAGAAVLPILGLSSAIGSVFKGVQLAGDAERLESNFKVLLGSAEKGKQMVAQLQDFAAKTPLNMGDLQSFAKQLLQAGIEAQDIIPTIKMLGDAAMGDAQKLQGLAYAFGQVKTFGRLMGGELMQLRNAGFDPIAEISRTTGKSMGVLRQEMERGLISFDMVSDAFSTATGAGGRFANGMEEASTTLTGLFSTMQDDIDASLREIGKTIIAELDLKGILKDVSALSGITTQWIKSLPAGVKTAIAGFVTLTILIGGLIAAMIVFKTVATLAFGGLNIVTAAIALALSAIVVGGTAAISSLGGVAAAWKWVKDRAIEFWEWLQPVRTAFVSMWKEVEKQALAAWEKILIFTKDTWQKIQDAVGMDSNEIRNKMVEGIMMIEFAVGHLPEIFELAWSGIKYGAVKAMNFMLENAFIPFFAIMAPALLLGMLVNWTDLWTNMVRFAKANMEDIASIFLGGFMGLLLRAPVVFAAIKAAALTGKMPDIKDLWKPIVDGGRRAADEVKFTWKGLKIPRLIALEETLKKEFDTIKDKVGMGWEEWRAKKLAEIGVPDVDAVAPAAEAAGKKIGKAMNTGLAKEVHKFDAVLFGSAEALARVAEYKERLLTGGTTGAAVGGVKPGGVPAPVKPMDPVPVVIGGDAGDGGKDKAAVLLGEIRDILRDRDDGGITIEGADLIT